MRGRRLVAVVDDYKRFTICSPDESMDAQIDTHVFIGLFLEDW